MVRSLHDFEIVRPSYGPDLDPNLEQVRQIAMYLR